MGMGIVDNKDFERELGSLAPSLPIPCENPKGLPGQDSLAIIEKIKRGRGDGDVEVPESLRKLIGQESVTEGRGSAIELANNFGVSPSSVSAYANGSNSTASYDTQPNLTAINEAKLRVTKKARNRLMMALNAITPEKMEGAKVREVAGIAKDMSAVIRNMEPEQSNRLGGGTGPTFVFYSPQPKTERMFEVVNVKE